MLTTDVLIVGAGPTGLTMASLLSRFGIPFLHIERNAEPSIHSKALVIQARTLELLEQLALTERFLEDGEHALALNMVVRGNKRAHIPLSEVGEGLTRHPYLFILEQFKTEKLFLSYLEEKKQSPRWQEELLSFRQDEESITAQIKTAEGKEETIRAKYLIAADGARSTVRNQLQLAFKGGTYENRFYVADVEVVGDIPVAPQEVSVCLWRESFLGFFPMKGTPGRFRIVGALPDELQNKEVIEFEDIRKEARIMGFAKETGFDLRDSLWHSVYKLHHRHVEQMSVGRAFLLGDAAHIHSPAGGQGMNTGIQDAFNLAWKLAYVLKGWSPPKLLATYHDERYPVAKALIQTTDRGFSIATSKRALPKFLRMVVAPLVFPLVIRFSFLRKRVFRLISQIGVAYLKSPLSRAKSLPKAKHLKAGQRCPDVLLADGSRLHPRLQQGDFFLLCVEQPALAQALQEEMRPLYGERVSCVASSAQQQDEARTALEKGEIFLIRPDGYLALAMGKDSPQSRQALKEYLATWLSPAPKS